MRSSRVLALILTTVLCAAGAEAGEPEAPLRIVITNDDGVGELDRRLIPLARELVSFAEVYIVVPSVDRSGTTNFMSVGGRHRSIESELLYAREATEGRHRVEIHSVDGYPADCVALAIGGLLGDEPPDLVISGPNGGANLGEDWFGSGTIGAARMAAHLGVPAVAVSGLDADEESAVKAVTQWVAQLARSEVVHDLGPGRYLTVGLPRTLPSEIRGVRVAPRAPRLRQYTFERTQPLRGAGDDSARQVWLLQPVGSDDAPPGTDVALYREGYIVVTPMRADEQDGALLESLQRQIDRMPPWEATEEPSRDGR